MLHITRSVKPSWTHRYVGVFIALACRYEKLLQKKLLVTFHDLMWPQEHEKGSLVTVFRFRVSNLSVARYLSVSNIPLPTLDLSETKNWVLLGTGRTRPRIWICLLLHSSRRPILSIFLSANCNRAKSAQNPIDLIWFEKPSRGKFKRTPHVQTTFERAVTDPKSCATDQSPYHDNFAKKWPRCLSHSLKVPRFSARSRKPPPVRAAQVVFQ